MYKYRWLKEENRETLDISSLKNEDGKEFEYRMSLPLFLIAKEIGENSINDWELYEEENFVVIHVWEDGDLSTRERFKIYGVETIEIESDWLEDDEDPDC
ncbi:hypothetical protein ABWE99_10865 [Pasteurella multocida]|uniref:hypothetical protein n=1 Tax=Pasteurella multocida TaxID=747 RepID=UPI00397CD883